MLIRIVRSKIFRKILLIICALVSGLIVIILIDSVKSAIIEKKEGKIVGYAEADDSLQIPEGLADLISDSDTEWMAGMRVLLSNCIESERPVSKNIDTYEFVEGIINASIELVNPLNKKQYYSIMVLADGIPQKFILNNNVYEQYFFDLIDRKCFEIEIEPVFSSNAGRLDFLLLYQEKTNCDYTMMSYTICIEQKEPVSISNHIANTFPVRSELENTAVGDAILSWLSQPEENDGDLVRGREIKYKADEPLILEAVTGRTCYHAILFYYNSSVIPVNICKEEKSLLYWESDPETMLQEEVVFDYGEGGCFSLILIPVEDFSKTTEKSFVMNLTKTEEYPERRAGIRNESSSRQSDKMLQKEMCIK